MAAIISCNKPHATAGLVATIWIGQSRCLLLKMGTSKQRAQHTTGLSGVMEGHSAAQWQRAHQAPPSCNTSQRPGGRLLPAGCRCGSPPPVTQPSQLGVSVMVAAHRVVFAWNLEPLNLICRCDRKHGYLGVRGFVRDNFVDCSPPHLRVAKPQRRFPHMTCSLALRVFHFVISFSFCRGQANF